MMTTRLNFFRNPMGSHIQHRSHIFVSISGGGGRMLNPESLKSVMKTYFGYLGAWGGGGFNTQSGPILVDIYPLF